MKHTAIIYEKMLERRDNKLAYVRRKNVNLRKLIRKLKVMNMKLSKENEELSHAKIKYGIEYNKKLRTLRKELKDFDEGVTEGYTKSSFNTP